MRFSVFLPKINNSVEPGGAIHLVLTGWSACVLEYTGKAPSVHLYRIESTGLWCFSTEKVDYTLYVRTAFSNVTFMAEMVQDLLDHTGRIKTSEKVGNTELSTRKESCAYSGAFSASWMACDIS